MREETLTTLLQYVDTAMVGYLGEGDRDKVSSVGSLSIRFAVGMMILSGLILYITARPLMEGIFYGLGDTRPAFFIETGSMWGIRILFTFLCVRWWNRILRAVWVCMIADNVTKAILFALLYWRKSW